MCFGVFRKGRGRPPTRPGVQGGNASQLAITTQPSSSATNGVNVSVVPVIQLRDAQGNNVAQTGVEITLTAVTGPSAVVTYTGSLGPNGGVLTDATGKATFTTFKLTGTSGSYQISFGATGFMSVTSSVVTLTAGAAVAATTTATVPDGVVGQLTNIVIQARDVSGNAVTTGGAAILVTVTGVNPIGPDPATDLGNGTYRYFYVATNGGTDTVAITLGGVGISGSPYTSLVTAGLSANVLRLGLFNYTDIGQGPDGTSGESYPICLFPPQTDANNLPINDQIDLADALDIKLVVNPSGGRNQFIVNGRFDFAAYKNRVNRFANNPKFADAVARQRILLFVIDEANITDFNNSLPPFLVNDCALYHKQLWNNAHTFVRMAADSLASGWNYQATAGGPIVFSPAPPQAYMSQVTNRIETGWSGLDYGWSQRSGQHNPPFPTTNAPVYTMQGYFDNQRQRLAAVNLGMVPGLNLWNGGIFSTLDGVAAIWNTGQGIGYIAGSTDTVPLIFLPSNTVFQNNSRRVVCPPDWIRHWADVVAADSLAAFGLIWSNSGPNTSVTDSRAVALQGSQAIIDALEYANTAMRARVSFAGLRPAKTIS